MLLDFLVDHPANDLLANTSVTSDICSKIVKAFDDDDVDVAMVMDVKDHRSTLGDDLVAEFDIEFAWMQTETFELEPNAPIPLATWPPDQHIILNALADNGRAYKVMFAGPDYSSKFTAVRSGQCLAVVPRNAIAPPFVEAEDELLPPIAAKKILLAVRGDPASERYRHIVSVLSSFHLAGIQYTQHQ
jgi:DNA-binding transcriptional LysR family regulator